MDYSTKMEDLLHQTEYQLDMQFYNIHFCILLHIGQKRVCHPTYPFHDN